MHKYILPALMALVLASCDDETGSLGLFDDTDYISNSTAVYTITSRSCLLSDVKANSTKSYLGNIVDPETGDRITASFASQFYCFEDYALPERSRMQSLCDSVDLRLYFDTPVGDLRNPLKLQVYELDPTKILSEDSIYYTDIDLSQYLPAGARPIAERVFTPTDYNLTEADRLSSSHNDNIHLRLPRELGERIMQKYYDDAANFKDSYHFIRNVFPGLYFRLSGGEGTMLSVYVSTINVYFSYKESLESDSVVAGLSRFTATPEVIQSTRFENDRDILSRLVADPTCTYLKTPAGIATELTLPVAEIFQGEHQGDSVSRAEVALTRYNKPQGLGQLGTPSELLMVRKQDAEEFFLKGHVSDNRTSFTTSFNPVYNTYTFPNIARLISYIYHEQEQAVEGGADREAWIAAHPDWNRVLIIPVTTSKATSTSNAYYYTGTSTSTQTSVTHDLSLSSIRLVGGQTPIKMQVVYSKFK